MFKSIIDVLLQIVKAFKTKPKVSDMLSLLLTTLPLIVQNILTAAHLTTKEKFDEGLIAFDAYTGSDTGAIDMIKDLPPAIEEEFMDHFKEMLRILAYNKMKIDGYYQEPEK